MLVRFRIRLQTDTLAFEALLAQCDASLPKHSTGRRGIDRFRVFTPSRRTFAASAAPSRRASTVSPSTTRTTAALSVTEDEEAASGSATGAIVGTACSDGAGTTTGVLSRLRGPFGDDGLDGEDRVRAGREGVRERRGGRRTEARGT